VSSRQRYNFRVIFSKAKQKYLEKALDFCRLLSTFEAKTSPTAQKIFGKPTFQKTGQRSSY
jgi:hypothetical protein